MKRVGIFTGKVYSQEDYDVHRIHECCICVDPAYEEEEGIRRAKERQMVRKLLVCAECNECEESLSQSKQVL